MHDGLAIHLHRPSIYVTTLLFVIVCHTHADSVLAYDVHSLIKPVDVTNGTQEGGYSMWQTNSTRICASYISDECLVKRGAAACIEEAEQVRRLRERLPEWHVRTCQQICASCR
jgi:hypothetical protein